MATCPPLRSSHSAISSSASRRPNTQVLYVDSGVANLLGDSPGTGALPDGSVISTTRFGGDFVNVYSAIASPDGNHANDVVTDILTNTRTGQTIDLSWLVNGLGFNAADVTPALPDYITGVGDPTVTAVTGLPPLTIAVQGYQTFEYLGADGEPIGHFNAVTTTTTDGFDFHTAGTPRHRVSRDRPGGRSADRYGVQHDKFRQLVERLFVHSPRRRHQQRSRIS